VLILAGFFYIGKKGALNWAADIEKKPERPESVKIDHAA
jgi:hypothetical protein